jgi:hypothetical protein
LRYGEEAWSPSEREREGRRGQGKEGGMDAGREGGVFVPSQNWDLGSCPFLLPPVRALIEALDVRARVEGREERREGGEREGWMEEGKEEGREGGREGEGYVHGCGLPVD